MCSRAGERHPPGDLWFGRWKHVLAVNPLSLCHLLSRQCFIAMHSQRPLPCSAVKHCCNTYGTQHCVIKTPAHAQFFDPNQRSSHMSYFPALSLSLSLARFASLCFCFVFLKACIPFPSLSLSYSPMNTRKIMTAGTRQTTSMA